jgi:hypothetical protein
LLLEEIDTLPRVEQTALLQLVIRRLADVQNEDVLRAATDFLRSRARWP